VASVTDVGELGFALLKGLQYLYLSALRARTLGHTKLRTGAGQTLLGSKAGWGLRPLLISVTTRHATTINIVQSCLNHASFVRAAALDAFLASLACGACQGRSNAYLKLERLTLLFLKRALPQPSQKLSVLGTALTATVYTLTVLYTLLFVLTLISTLSLALVCGQILSASSALLVRSLKLGWGLCSYGAPSLFWALRLSLALGLFMLNRLMVLFTPLNPPKGPGAPMLRLEEPFISKVLRKIQRRAWPLYTDEFGRSYFRRTSVGGVLILVKASSLKLKLRLKKALKVFGFLLFAVIIFLMIFSLPAGPLTRARASCLVLLACLGLKVIFEVKLKARRFVQWCRCLRAKADRYPFVS
jgi:hypothetical protein